MSLQMERTEEALAEVNASHVRKRGSHRSSVVRTRSSGRFVEEVAFKRGVHRQSDVNPFSITGIVTGKKFVKRINPQNPLELTVITHRNPGENSHPSIVEAKQLLADGIRLALTSSLPGPTDRIEHYVVGEPTENDKSYDDVKVISGTKNPAKAASKIIDISQEAKGPTIVISPSFDELVLPKTEINRETLTGMIGVNISHPIELDLSHLAGQNAVIRTGGTGEVDLLDEEQVEYVNNKLQTYHNRTVDQMRQSGLAVANVVFHAEMEYGLNLDATDIEVANAISQANNKYQVSGS
jgi:hypothetical protein